MNFSLKSDLWEEKGERLYVVQAKQIRSVEESYLWGRIGRQAVHPRTDRPRWLLRPEHERRTRRPRCRPDTWSDQCHQTEWQMPGSPGLTPAERETDFVYGRQKKTPTKYNVTLITILPVSACVSVKSGRKKRRRQCPGRERGRKRTSGLSTGPQ